MMNELQGKAAIITGASQGIGRAISLALSDKGASVVLAARSEGATKIICRGENGLLRSLAPGGSIRPRKPCRQRLSGNSGRARGQTGVRVG